MDEERSIIKKAVEIEREILELYKRVSESMYFMSMDASILLEELSKKVNSRVNQLQTHNLNKHS